MNKDQDLIKECFQELNLYFPNDVAEKKKIIIGNNSYDTNKKESNLDVVVPSSDNKYSMLYGNKVKTVAFLTKNFAEKHPLLMIFNLLFGTENSAKLLTKLRIKEISPQNFYKYLVDEFKVYLVNQDEIKKPEKSSDNNVSNNEILLCGNNAIEKLKKHTKYKSIIHPSNQNFWRVDAVQMWVMFSYKGAKYSDSKDVINAFRLIER